MQITQAHASVQGDKHVILDDTGALMPYGAGLKALKKLLKLKNNGHLGAMTGYSRRAVDDWTQGRVEPPAPALIIMAIALNHPDALK